MVDQDALVWPSRRPRIEGISLKSRRHFSWDCGEWWPLSASHPFEFGYEVSPERTPQFGYGRGPVRPFREVFGLLLSKPAAVPLWGG
jgi:hypothetical protein